MDERRVDHTSAIKVPSIILIERVPLKATLLRAAEGRSIPLTDGPTKLADPAQEILATEQAELTLLLGDPGLGKTVTVTRAFSAASRRAILRENFDFLELAKELEEQTGTFRDNDKLLLLDGLAGAPRDLQGFQSLIAAIRTRTRQVVITATPQVWHEVETALWPTLILTSRHVWDLRVRILELMPWERDQVRDLLMQRKDRSSDPKQRSRLQAFDAWLTPRRIGELLSDLSGNPHLLRLLFDLAEEKGLPSERYNRTSLVRDWEALRRCPALPVPSSPRAVPRKQPAKPSTHQTSVAPPDLEIRVSSILVNGEPYLHYNLRSTDHYERSILGKKLTQRPQDYFAALRSLIAKANKKLDEENVPLSGQEIRRELETLGQKLYTELFSAEMRAAYRVFHRSVQTLQITSDEPWIPWELVRPYDDSDPSDIIDHSCLAEKFQLTRWLAGGRAPATEIRVSRLACVEAAAVDFLRHLPCAEEEREWMTELAQRHKGVVDLSLASATYPATVARLSEGRIQLFHFVGHGEFNADQPDSSPFSLTDGRSLRPRDLQGPIQTRMKRAQPLIFLNACEATQQGWSLTGLAGWVSQWILGCGCGALVGPQWTVRDRLSIAFAKSFYTALEQGETFGAAAQIARDTLRQINPNHPSWLAFAVYAHPNGRLVFGK